MSKGLLQGLKKPQGAARHLTKALRHDDPANFQGALLDVVQAQGGIRATAKKAGLPEWRLRLILSDEEEAAKVLRLVRVVRAVGMKASFAPIKRHLPVGFNHRIGRVS